MESLRVKCAECGKSITKYGKQLRLYNRAFCSRECYHKCMAKERVGKKQAKHDFSMQVKLNRLAETIKNG